MNELNFNFNTEETQLLYYLVKKESRLTERSLSGKITDKNTNLDSYKDTLQKNAILESLRKKVGKKYGELHAR
jgi:hypothetical protein|tara:strand:- start:1569 stop:1787 length:219 start_codon:yes stop_codon:yes gene_type:complete